MTADKKLRTVSLFGVTIAHRQESEHGLQTHTGGNTDITARRAPCCSVISMARLSTVSLGSSRLI
ncbi:MAG: hypothetical protein RIC89_14015, partial [Pseudomonadales bacterium]